MKPTGRKKQERPVNFFSLKGWIASARETGQNSAVKKIITTELVRTAIISWCKTQVFHLWLWGSLPTSRCLNSSPSTQCLNSAAQTQPTLLTSVHRDVSWLMAQPTSSLPTAEENETFAGCKENKASTQLFSCLWQLPRGEGRGPRPAAASFLVSPRAYLWGGAAHSSKLCKVDNTKTYIWCLQYVVHTAVWCLGVCCT